MTVLVSFASEKAIIMCADSAVTHYFCGDQGEYREYDTGSKLFVFPDIGIISTWGDRTRNRIYQFVQEHQVESKTHSIDDLAGLVCDFILNYLKPKENGMEDVGFHVGGYDKKGNPKLYHIFWGYNRPRTRKEVEPDFYCYDHTDKGILFNGRNDLAFMVIQTLLSQIKQRNDTRYDISSLIGLLQLCDLVVRFSAEITPEVGPPFNYCVISPDRAVRQFTNEAFSPIRLEETDPLFNDANKNTLIVISEDSLMVAPVFVQPSGTVLYDEALGERNVNIGSTGGTILPLGSGHL